VLAFGTEHNPPELSAADRTLGDLCDPTRPGGVTALLNVVTQATGQDPAEWPVSRLLRMADQLNQTHG